MNDTSLTTTSILALFQTTKEERQSFVADVLSKIEAGDVDPLKIHLQVKCTEDVMKLLTSNDIYRRAVVAEAEKQGKKSFEYHNSKFDIREVGVKYDYEKCNDQILNGLFIELELLSEKVKERQEMLKRTPGKGMMLVNEDTGEAFTVYPPAKSSTTNVAVTLK